MNVAAATPFDYDFIGRARRLVIDGPNVARRIVEGREKVVHA